MKAFHALGRIGTTPQRFQFDFVLHSASNVPSTGTLFVSINRGGKVAIGRPAAVDQSHSCRWTDEKLSIIATLYKEGKGANATYQEKSARISTKESMGKKGNKKFGEKTINLADYASMNGSKTVDLLLNEGGTVEKEHYSGVKLNVTIQCTWLKDDVHAALDQSSEVSDMTHTVDRGDGSDDDADNGGSDGEQDDHPPAQQHKQPAAAANAKKTGSSTALRGAASSSSSSTTTAPATTTNNNNSSSSSSSGASAATTGGGTAEKELEVVLQKYRELEGSNKLLEQRLANTTRERDALTTDLQTAKDQIAKDQKRIDKLLKRLEEAESATTSASTAATAPAPATATAASTDGSAAAVAAAVAAAAAAERERELQGKIAGLNKELDALHRESDQTVREIQERYAEEKKALVARIGESEQQLAQAVSGGTSTTKELQEKWAEERRALQARIVELEHKEATAKAEFLANRFIDTEEDGNLSDEEVGAKKKGGAGSSKSVKELQLENASLKSVIAAKDKQAQDMEAERGELVQQLVTTKMAFAESQESVDVLKKKLSSAINDKLKLSQRMTALEVKVVEASKNNNNSRK